MSIESGSNPIFKDKIFDPVATSVLFRDRPIPSDSSTSTPEIYEIMPALNAGVAELKAAIVNGDYGILISDDVSGRIPTLILRGVIDHVNSADGRPPIPTVFVKGQEAALSQPDEERLTKELQRLAKESKGTRALIVTEFMEGGLHVKSIADVIHDAEISLDIFAASKKHDTQVYRRRNVLRDDEEIFPIVGYMTHYPGIYRRTRLSGSIEDKEGVYVDIGFRGTLIDVRGDIKAAVAQLISNHFLLAA